MEFFLEHIRSVFEETDPSLIQETTIFRDLEEWDSMLALSIIAIIDEEYSVNLTGEDIRTAKTIADLFNKVSEKKA
jgi:acyl carrier protein